MDQYQDPELTKREKQIADKLADGFSQREISVQLGRSRQTVYTHIKNLRLKFGAQSTPQLRRLLMSRKEGTDD